MRTAQLVACTCAVIWSAVASAQEEGSFLPPPLRSTAEGTASSPGLPPAAQAPEEGEAPFRKSLQIRPLTPSPRDGRGESPTDDDWQQKDERLQSLLGELPELQPGEYGGREKLLEMLQLERIVALRQQAAEASRAKDAEAAEEPGESTQKAVALRTSIWPTRTIQVTWDCSQTTFDRYASERQWVRDAIRATWERESAVRFTNWGRSQSAGTAGIRIAISDEGPHCKGLGSRLNGMRAGMVLNFTFRNWCTACATNRRNSIMYIAVHEFGHALGLAHEQNRRDAPLWCQQERQGTNGDWFVTIYDPQSIMNYCSDRWNNDGRLTELDKRAIRIMYGNPLVASVSGSGGAPFQRPLQGVGEGDEEPGRYGEPKAAARPATEEQGRRLLRSGEEMLVAASMDREIAPAGCGCGFSHATDDPPRFLTTSSARTFDPDGGR